MSRSTKIRRTGRFQLTGSYSGNKPCKPILKVGCSTRYNSRVPYVVETGSGPLSPCHCIHARATYWYPPRMRHVSDAISVTTFGNIKLSVWGAFILGAFILGVFILWAFILRGNGSYVLTRRALRSP